MEFRNLVRRARAGSDAAMNELLEQVYPRVREVVHRTMPRRRRESLRRLLITYSTSDLLQEIFIKMVIGLTRFTGEDEATLINYLSALVRNTLIDRLRYFAAGRRDPRCIVDNLDCLDRLDRRDRLNRRNSLDNLTTSADAQALPASGEASPSSQAAANEQVDLYRDVLLGFPERERRLLQMRIEGATPFAILARELTYASEDAARKAYNAAKARLLVRLRGRGVGL